jgi:hypothetical protein
MALANHSGGSERGCLDTVRLQMQAHRLGMTGLVGSAAHVAGMTGVRVAR